MKRSADTTDLAQAKKSLLDTNIFELLFMGINYLKSLYLATVHEDPISSLPPTSKLIDESSVQVAKQGIKPEDVIDLSDDDDDIDLEVPNKTMTVQHQQVLAASSLKQCVQKTVPTITLNTVRFIEQSDPDLKLKSKIFEAYQNDATVKTQLVESMLELDGHADIHSISKEASHKLFNHQWIDSHIVNNYFGILAKQNTRIAVLESYHRIQDDLIARITQGTYLKWQKSALLAADKILWPVCSGKHWYLIMMEKINADQYQLTGLDGLHADNTLKRHMAFAKQVLQALKPGTIISQEKIIHVPKQHNDLDCAAVVCYWGSMVAQHQALQLPSEVKECDYSEFRFDMADMIVKDLCGAKQTLKA